MLIYLWEDPYTVPYGKSVLAACASTEEEARQKILAKLATWDGYCNVFAQEAIAHINSHPATQQNEVIDLEWSE